MASITDLAALSDQEADDVALPRVFRKESRTPKLPQRNSYLAAIVEHHLWWYIWCHIHFAQ